MTMMAESSISGEQEPPPLSKNRLKKLKRDQEWEAKRAERKAKRKEKAKEKKLRKRAAFEEAGLSTPIRPGTIGTPLTGATCGYGKTSIRPQSSQLPITIVLDCGFDNLMTDKERKSLGSQVTRCYSDNHRAPYQSHLAISSFGGHLKERFDGILAGHYHSWRNVRFLEGNFVEASAQAKEWMRGKGGGKLAGVFSDEHHSDKSLEDQVEHGEVVYLSSDSPDTLTELRPYSTYIIGGLVDRNRHKGICYKKALDRGVKTAKLPIGDYMKMTSRFVLATNHVAEIMLRWLEHGDWGKAFLQVVPKRKGGTLKDGLGAADEGEVDGKIAHEEDEEADGKTSKDSSNSTTLLREESPDPVSGTAGEDGGADTRELEGIIDAAEDNHDAGNSSDSESDLGGCADLGHLDASHNGST